MFITCTKRSIKSAKFVSKLSIYRYKYGSKQLPISPIKYDFSVDVDWLTFSLSMASEFPSIFSLDSLKNILK